MKDNSAVIEPTIDDVSSEALEKVGDVIAKIAMISKSFFKRL